MSARSENAASNVQTGPERRFVNCKFIQCNFEGAIWDGAILEIPQFEQCPTVTFDFVLQSYAARAGGPYERRR